MKEQVTIIYEAPRVEIIEVQVERGFAASYIGGKSEDEVIDDAIGGNFPEW